MTNPDKDLRTVGRDISDARRLSPNFTTPQTRLPETMEKSALLLVNSVTSYRLSLGTGPVNDAVMFGELLKEYGFDVYFLVRPQGSQLLELLDAFFTRTTKQFVLFYVGHGHDVHEELDKTRNSGHAFEFSDGVVREEELIDHLTAHKTPENEVIVVADACIPGTIWDIQDGTVNGKQLPPRVLSLSSKGKPVSASISSSERKQNGVFTTTLTKAFTELPELTPLELPNRMKAALRAIGREFLVGTSSPELLTQPCFMA
jgi:hypothetical protein